MARPPPRAQQLQDPLPILSTVHLDLLEATDALGAGTWSEQCPGQAEARSEAASAFLFLKPEQDYFNFPNRMDQDKTTPLYFVLALPLRGIMATFFIFKPSDLSCSFKISSMFLVFIFNKKSKIYELILTASVHLLGVTETFVSDF